MAAPMSLLAIKAHLIRIKKLLQMPESSYDLVLAYVRLGLVVHSSLHILLMPFVGGQLAACQESLSQDDKGTIVLFQQPHDPQA